MSDYGYLHLGRILSYDTATKGYYLEGVGLARTSRWGPVPSCVPGLAAGDRVVLGATGTSRDALTILTKVDATFPDKGDITGLMAALALKADNTDLTSTTNRTTALEGRTTSVESRETAVEGRMTTSEKAVKTLVDTQAKTYLPVCNGTHFNGNGGAPSTSLIQARCRQSRKMLRVIAGGATELQVEWANLYTNNTPQAADASCELNGPNAVTVRMAIEYPAGTMKIVSGSAAWSSTTAYALLDQVTYNGAKWLATQAGTNQAPAAGSAYWRPVRTYIVNWSGQTDTSGTVAFQPGDYKISLPVILQETAQEGDCLAVLGAFDSGSATGYIPYAGANGAANHGAFVDWVVDVAAGLPALGSALPDTGVTTQTNGNTTAAGAASNANWMQIPYATAVTGNSPSRRCVALFGDSLIQGSGGYIRDGEPCGIFPRALDGVSWWRIAQGGNRAQCYAPGNAPWQMSVIARCTAVVCNLALNDVSAGATSAQTQQYMTRAWRMLSAAGPPVYAGLLTPISASTDVWATTANQSRFTNGGTIPTTQYPTDDATYLTSVYGVVGMWLSQDGAQITTPDGATVKAGQASHPLETILDWRSLMADTATSWKWGANYTTDGAHPTQVGAQAQAAYLTPQLEPVLMGRRQINPGAPTWTVVGDTPLAPFGRSLCRDLTPTASGSVMSVLGVSPGRWFYGVRVWAGTAVGVRSYTILTGADLAKMKVLQSATVSSAANSYYDNALTGGPVWIPAGQVVAIALTSPAASSWGGATAVSAGLHQTGVGHLLAGASADTAVLSGVISLHSTGKFSTGLATRLWGEVY